MRWVAAWVALGIAWMLVFEARGPLARAFVQIDQRFCKVHRPLDNFMARLFAVGCMCLFAIVIGAIAGPLAVVSTMLPVPKGMQRWQEDAWDWDKKDREEGKRK